MSSYIHYSSRFLAVVYLNLMWFMLQHLLEDIHYTYTYLTLYERLHTMSCSANGD